MTLSHCWGAANFIKLTEFTYKYLTTELTISDLPNTFRDAVIAAKKLGICYIWIDSLCILQDSKDDWRQEAGAMKDVYKNAACNIAATGSVDSAGGCFKDRFIGLVQPCILDKGPFGQAGKFVLEQLGLWDTDVNSAPLDGRAWVTQERLLSRRILHFGKEQLFWECRELDACETYPDGMPYQFLKRANAATKLGLGLDINEAAQNEVFESRLNRLWSIHEAWADVVEAYRRCNLTKPEDKLVAFSGIAKEVQSLLGNESHYLAGLWSDNLLCDLMWKVNQCQKADGSPSSRPMAYRAPSWSWAAVDAAGPGASSSLVFPLATVQEASVTPTIDQDYTGQIVAGEVRLQGCLIKVKPRTIHVATCGLFVTAAVDFGKGSLRSEFLVAPDVRVHRLDIPLYLFPIDARFMYKRLSVAGLALQQVIPGNTHLYRRFGTFLGFSTSRWSASNLPSNVSDLFQSFAPNLGQYSGNALSAHYEDEELNKLVMEKFDQINEKLVESLQARYSEGKHEKHHIFTII